MGLAFWSPKGANARVAHAIKGKGGQILIICECDRKAHQLCLEALDALNMAFVSQGKVHALKLQLFELVSRNVSDEEAEMRDLQVQQTLFELQNAREITAGLVAAVEAYSPDVENAVYQATHCPHKGPRLGLGVRIGFICGSSGEISELADEAFESGPWVGFPIWAKGFVGQPQPRTPRGFRQGLIRGEWQR